MTRFKGEIAIFFGKNTPLEAVRLKMSIFDYKNSVAEHQKYKKVRPPCVVRTSLMCRNSAYGVDECQRGE